MANAIKVTIWNEFRHEKKKPAIAAMYPKGMHGAIGEYLTAQGGMEVRLAALDDPEQGLPDALLADTDVLLWWGHGAHKEVLDTLVDKVQNRVLEGMGLVVLHSGHHSKPFKRLMGTTCNLRWREIGEREIVWCVSPGHPIAQGIGPCIVVPNSEMYGEQFDIPQPDELIFISNYAGGEVFRSGCTFRRGAGKIFYFSPGHETYPIYHNPEILRVIANGIHWAAPSGAMKIECPKSELGWFEKKG